MLKARNSYQICFPLWKYGIDQGLDILRVFLVYVKHLPSEPISQALT